MGHVDGISRHQAVEQAAASWEMKFTASDALAPSGDSSPSLVTSNLRGIAVNGVSLTGAEYDELNTVHWQ